MNFDSQLTVDSNVKEYILHIIYTGIMIHDSFYECTTYTSTIFKKA